jgi:hypothetical protein
MAMLTLQRATAALFASADWVAQCSRLLVEVRKRYREWPTQESREARGITLLSEWLTIDQRAQFEAEKCFEVIGCDTGKRYRILHGTAVNVHELNEDGRPLMGWCFVPRGDLVPGDVMLAQKIALETNERAALAVANHFPVHAPLRQTTCDRRRAYPGGRIRKHAALSLQAGR